MKEGHGRAIPHHAMFDGAFQRDPYAFYDYLRSDAPVVWDDVLRAWIVTRWDDVHHVLQDSRTYSSDRVTLARQRFPDPSLVPLFDALSHLMLQTDEPVHTRLRGLVNRAFQRAAIETYAPRVEALARDLIGPARQSGHMEFVSEFAVPLPVMVISDVVGIPLEDREKVKSWCDDFSIVALNFYARITDAQLAAGLRAIEAFSAYLAELVDRRRSQDGNDLLTTMVEAEEAGERLSFDELLANTILLLNAGNETTTILLVNALHALATQPGLAPALRADRTLIPKAVEETLRFAPPVQFIGRVVAADTVLGGEKLRKGDLVLTFLASANRDENHYVDPDQFDPGRSRLQHLAFSSGPHVCVGLQLGRLEGRVAVETMLDTFADIRLAEMDLRYGPNANLRCFERLPLDLTPR